jgi:hypothetical protein
MNFGLINNQNKTTKITFNNDQNNITYPAIINSIKISSNTQILENKNNH